MNNGNSQLPPLRLWLSVEAAARINKRISRRQISILKTDNIRSLSDCRYCIADEAEKILRSKKESLEGVEGEKNVQNWLQRDNSKALPVFKALCQAVEEDWYDSFDKSQFEEILKIERIRLRNTFTDSFLSLFGIPLVSETKDYAIRKYRKVLDTLLSNRNIEAQVAEKWVEDFLSEFAVNGRQISFQIRSSASAYYITSVTIRGKNQHNKDTKWKRTLTPDRTSHVATEGWWWKGPVEIKFEYCIGEKVFTNCCEVIISAQGFSDSEVIFNCDTLKCYTEN